MEIVNVDKSGRLVIPEFIRKKLHLSKEVPLLITEIDDDKILIKKSSKEYLKKINLVMQFAPVILTDCDLICHNPMLRWLQYNKKEASYDQFHHDRGFSKKPG